MSVADWFQRLVKKDAQHYVYARIPATAARQDPPIQEVELQAERHYVRFWLAEMFLKDDRRLFREFVPVVHSNVTLRFGSKPVQELPYVAGPQNVGLGSTLGRGVQLDHPLTNLLPYRGGTLTVAAALLAYQRKDFFQALVEILHDVSGLLNVGQLSSTLKVIDSAVDGVQSLLGAQDKDVHLVYFEGFGGSTAVGGASLKSGYTAVVRANAQRFERDKLFVKDSQLYFGNDLASSRPLDGYDYMVIRTEAATTRDDFLSFDEFGKLLADAIREGFRDRASGDAIIKTAQIAAWASPDLTNADRLRVAKALQAEYERALSGDPADEARSPMDRRLEILNEQILSISPEKATDVADTLASGEMPRLDKFLEMVL